MSEMDDSSEQQRERDRNQRGEKSQRFSERKKDRSRERRTRSNCIYVSNIPYEYRWNEVKDLFRKHVGDVSFVELFNDENNKPRGCGVVEFCNAESVKKAMEVMHRFSIEGRKLVIKEDSGNERDKYGHIIKGGGSRDDNRLNSRFNKSDSKIHINSSNFDSGEQYNTYGLSAQFLETIGIREPLCNKVFVANLDYKVDKAKLKEVFKMAGKVRNIDLSTDKDGNSRGFAVVEYDHPVEAVQAISMFDRQFLYERKLNVRMDRVTSEKSEIRLPEGLKGIGCGLGANGEPLHDVARYIQNQMNLGINNQQAGILGAMPNNNINLGNVNASALGNSMGTGNLTGNLGLNNLGLNFLQQNLAHHDMNSGNNVGNISGMGMGEDMQHGASGLMGNNSNFNRSIGMSQNMNFSQQNMGRNNLFNVQSDMNMANSQLFGNLPIKDNSSMNQKTSKDSIQITNLPATMTWQLLREKFGEVGEVKFADKTGPDSAFIRFHNERSAARAIQMFDRTRIDGRTIDVQYY